MPEILTESFCERCGTRYTFESASPKGARLKGLRTVSRGLRNFVMSDDTSIDEAMAAARNETDREVTSQQLDAFHKTFNFCMSCRQYTCGNCWNEVEGRCLSCAPHLGHEMLPEPFPNVDTSSALPFGLSSPVAEDRNGHDQPEVSMPEPMAWPTSDLMREEEQAGISFETVLAEHEAEAIEEVDPLARLAAWESSPAPDAIGEVAEPVDEPVAVALEPDQAEPEPVTAEWEAVPVAPAQAPAEPLPSPWQPQVEPVATDATPAFDVEEEAAPAEFDDRAAAATAQTSDLFRRFSAAGQELDDAIAAYELAQAAADALAEAPAAESAPEPEPTPVQPATAPAVQPPPAPAAQPAPRPAPELETEPVAAAAQPQPAPLPEPEPEPIAAVAWPEPTPQREPEPEPLAPVVPPQTAPAPDLDRIAAAAQPAFEPEPTLAHEPEPVAAPIAPQPEYEPEPEPVAAVAPSRDDLVAQPTWQIVAPESPPEPEWPAQPQWPTQPEWPSRPTTDGLAFLGRPAQPSGGIEALWAESAREVASAAAVTTTAGPVGVPAARPSGGVQPCVSCGLSLSANARFCRRCGSRQG